MRQVNGMSDCGNEIIIKKFKGIDDLSLFPCEDETQCESALFLDVETTGFDSYSETIIDIGLIRILYHKETGRLVKVCETYESLNDPQKKISTEITQLTGLTNEDVKGQSIDWTQVKNLFQNSKIILAHNARFDRAFLDKALPLSQEKVWGCTMDLISWKEKGHGGRSLEYLLKDHGKFFKGHRALNDVWATVYLITHIDPDTNAPYLNELLENHQKPLKWVHASRAAFSVKDTLKGRGYQWDNKLRVWKIRVDAQSEKEENFLRNLNGGGVPQSFPINPTDAYKMN